MGLLFLSACSAPDFYGRINTKVERQDYASALKEINDNKSKYYPDKNALLYFLDSGLLNHLAGNFNESNAAFEKAKLLADDYYTKSVTKEMTTFLINDTMRPYYGEDFERALIYLFKALNYVCLGNPDEALVEARQLNHFLQTLDQAVGGKNVYKEDAFGRYLMGIVWEAALSKEAKNDALIEYKNALSIYEANLKNYGTPAPLDVSKSIVRLAQELGFADDVDWYSRKYNINKNKIPKIKEEIVLIHLNGPAPKKINHFIELTLGEGWASAQSVKTTGKESTDVAQAQSAMRAFSAKKTFKVAFPEYTQEPFNCNKIDIEVSGGDFSGKTQPASNISLIAQKNLDDRITRIRARAITRAWTKNLIALSVEEKTKKERGELTGLLAGGLMRAAGSATEVADLRAWQTLPARIDIARIPVQPGTYHLRLLLKNASGNLIGEKVINDVKVEKNKKTFVTVRTLQ